ncbi:MAG TPA: peptidoglycan editing factor PgeF [Bryobacteraceae bacterium]
MFRKDSHNIYRAGALERLDWLDHGFGTRLSDGWAPAAPAWVRQVHSARVIEATAAGCLGEADALVTATPGLYVSIRTADCVPILIADERRRAVAAVHAGWRGTADAIVVEALKEMGRLYKSRPKDLLAAIGPAVCGSCYEVGPEVAARFTRWFPERRDLDGRARLDLVEANRRQLVEAGLDPARISTGAPCTACNPGEFYSWRRDREQAGRMVAAIAVRP